MRCRYILFIGLLCFQTNGCPKTTGRFIAGVSALGIELFGIPISDWYVNWRVTPGINNPFKNIKEKEPFHQDEMWHFAASGITTRLNYHILKEYLGVKDPFWTNAVGNAIFWTGMELLDGTLGSGFSIRDEIGNLCGVAFSSLKLRYPDLPFFVRLGVADWSRLISYASKGFNQFNRHKYYFMKVDILYTTPYYLYGGLSISTKEKSRSDKLGITTGFDLAKALNDSSKGWWNGPLDFILETLNISVNFTYWID